MFHEAAMTLKDKFRSFIGTDLRPIISSQRKSKQSRDKKTVNKYNIHYMSSDAIHSK